eukprot:g13807.t1
MPANVGSAASFVWDQKWTALVGLLAYVWGDPFMRDDEEDLASEGDLDDPPLSDIESETADTLANAPHLTFTTTEAPVYGAGADVDDGINKFDAVFGGGTNDPEGRGASGPAEDFASAPATARSTTPVLATTTAADKMNFYQDWEVLRMLKDQDCLRLLANNVEVRKYSQGDFVIRRGGLRDAFLLVKSGEFQIFGARHHNERGQAIVEEDLEAHFEGGLAHEAPAQAMALHRGDTIVGFLFVLAAIITGSPAPPLSGTTAGEGEGQLNQTRSPLRHDSSLRHESSVRCTSARGGEVYVLRSDRAILPALAAHPAAMLGLIRHLLARMVTVVSTLHKYFGLSADLLHTGDVQEIGVSFEKVFRGVNTGQAGQLEELRAQEEQGMTRSWEPRLVDESDPCMIVEARLGLPSGSCNRDRVRFVDRKIGELLNVSDAEQITQGQEGELLGVLPVLACMPQYSQYRCKTECRLIQIDREEVERLLQQHPLELSLNLLQAFIPKVKPSVRRIEAAVESRLVAGGKPVFLEGESSSRGFYIVSSGKLWLVPESALSEGGRGGGAGGRQLQHTFCFSDVGLGGAADTSDAAGSGSPAGKANSKNNRRRFQLYDKQPRYLNPSQYKIVRKGGICGESDTTDNADGCSDPDRRNDKSFPASSTQSQKQGDTGVEDFAKDEDAIPVTKQKGGAGGSIVRTTNEWPHMTSLCFVPADAITRDKCGGQLAKSIGKLRPTLKLTGFADVGEKWYAIMGGGAGAVPSPDLGEGLLDGRGRSGSFDELDRVISPRDRPSRTPIPTDAPMDQLREHSVLQPKAAASAASIFARKTAAEPPPAAVESSSRRRLGRHVLAKMLSDLEERCDCVLYVADETPTDWTRVCLRQADLVLVAITVRKSDVTPNPKAGSAELFALKHIKQHVPVEFLLVHEDEIDLMQDHGGQGTPRGEQNEDVGQNALTAENLKKQIENFATQMYIESDQQNLAGAPGQLDQGTFGSRRDMLRPGMRNAVKAQMEKKLPGLKNLRGRFSTRHYLKMRIVKLRQYGNTSMRYVHHARLDKNESESHQLLAYDLDRCARIVHKRAIAIILGGGGAKGHAHFGVLQALRELQIPVDIVCGCSMGSMAAGIYAMYPDFDVCVRKAKWIFETQFTRSKMYSDLTYPILSYFSGNFHNTLLKQTFARVHLEDLLVPFACTSLDILNCEPVIHRDGELWRSVRASMSLVGFVPPFPGEKDADGNVTSLLVDGCYANNFPIQTAQALGAGVVFTVDVAGLYDHFDPNYGDACSGWRLLYDKWFGDEKAKSLIPTSSAVTDRILNMANVQKHKDFFPFVDLSLRPPIDPYGLLDFDKFEELYDVGYQYALPLFEDFMDATEKGLLLKNALARGDHEQGAGDVVVLGDAAVGGGAIPIAAGAVGRAGAGEGSRRDSDAGSGLSSSYISEGLADAHRASSEPRD